MSDLPAERSGFVTADGHRLEYRAWGDVSGGRPTLVFLHEGLGCAALWRDFPGRASARTGLPALAYSRYGYGRSDAFTEPRTPRFMHDEATGALPELLERLSIARPILVGHSDGGSIALIHAAAHPAGPMGVVALAPHLFVERETIASIADIAARFPASDLPRRMAKYHRDPDATFHGWADIWLDPAFRAWNIEAEVTRVACPVLALQGREDEYGTMRQVERIAELCRHARWIALERCGHSPFADQPDRVLTEIEEFVAGLTTKAGDPIHEEPTP
jgi:pimeloyl-ACP methyl ester carboxylesterase